MAQLESLVETLDFNTFYSSNARIRTKFCENLVTSIGKHGFVKLVNHGIPKALVQEAFEIGFDQSTGFFHLPMEKKRLSLHPPADVPHRGFSPMGMENIGLVTNFGVEETYHSKVALKDMKETYDMGFKNDPVYENIWPDTAMPEFKPFMQNFWDVCYVVQQDVFEAIAIGLHLDNAAILADMHLHQVNEMRLTHYPEIKLADLESDGTSQKTRISPHTDFGSITFLFQDSVGGLEAEDQQAKGVFRPVEPGEIDEMILNAGDCMQFWTANRIPAARHRVHAPSTAKSVTEPGGGVQKAHPDEVLSERFSVAFFTTPDRTASLQTLNPEWFSEKYSTTMTAGEFQLSRSSGTY